VAVSTIEPPLQIDPVAGEILPVGAVVCVMIDVLSAGPLHVPCLMIAKYVPGAVAFNVAPVSPSISFPLRNHVYDVPPVAVSVNEPPSQMLPVAGLIVPTGVGVIVITDVFDASPLQLPW
jgi:hypothetical protein